MMGIIRYKYLKQALSDYDAVFSAFEKEATDETRAAVDQAWNRLQLGIIPQLHRLIALADVAVELRDYQDSIGGHVIPNNRQVEHLMELHEKYLAALKALDDEV